MSKRGAIPAARAFVRGNVVWRVGYADDVVLEQTGDETPREKKLTSREAIVRAVDKAIEKRLADGFTEVTSPPPPDVDAAPRFDEAALAEIHPLRRVPGPRRAVDAGRAWSIVRSACNDLAAYLDEAPDGAESHAEGEVREAVSWLRQVQPTPLADPSALAAAAFLLAGHAATAALEGALDVVVAGADAARATEMFLGYLQRCDRWVVLPVGDEAARQQPGADLAAGPGALRVLRAHLAQAPEEVYERARSIAESARQGASRATRVAIAYAFPDVPAWANEDARAANVAQDPFAPERWLLTAATDRHVLHRLGNVMVPVDVTWRGRTAATAKALAKFRKKLWSMSLEAIEVINTLTGEPVDDVPLTMVAAAGDDALLGLEMLRDSGAHSMDRRMPHEVPVQRAVFRAITCLPTDAGFDQAIVWARTYAESRLGPPEPLRALLILADLAPRRAMAALSRARNARPAREVDPLLARLERDLAARLGAATVASAAPAAAREPATGLAAVMLEGDAKAILDALETATAKELEDVAAHLSWDQLGGLADQIGAPLLDVLDRRFEDTWAAARIAGDLHSIRSNPQFQANSAAAFLEKHESEEAFAYALECLRHDAMIRELDHALEAHWKRVRSAEERRLRATRIADAAAEAREGEYAERWRARASS